MQRPNLCKEKNNVNTLAQSQSRPGTGYSWFSHLVWQLCEDHMLLLPCITRLDTGSNAGGCLNDSLGQRLPLGQNTVRWATYELLRQQFYPPCASDLFLHLTTFRPSWKDQHCWSSVMCCVLNAFQQGKFSTRDLGKHSAHRPQVGRIPPAVSPMHSPCHIPRPCY